MAANYQRPEIIAQLFGVSVRRVQQLTQEGVLTSDRVPGEAGRKYDLIPNIQAYIKYLSDKAYGKSRTDKELDLKNKKLEVEIALKESQGELHRLRTDIQMGKYILVEEAKLDYQRFFVTLKKFVTAIPSRVGVMLNGYAEPVIIRGIENDLAHETADILNTFVSAAIENKKPLYIEREKPQVEEAPKIKIEENKEA